MVPRGRKACRCRYEALHVRAEAIWTDFEDGGPSQFATAQVSRSHTDAQYNCCLVVFIPASITVKLLPVMCHILLSHSAGCRSFSPVIELKVGHYFLTQGYYSAVNAIISDTRGNERYQRGEYPCGQ